MATSQFQTSDTPISTPTNTLRNGVASGEDGVHDNPPRHVITDRDGVRDIKSVPRTSQCSRISDSNSPNEATYQIRCAGLQFALGGV